MNLQDLYEKHQQELDRYKALTGKLWDELIHRQEKLIEAFKNRENLPPGYTETMGKEKDDFNNLWAAPYGTNYKNMVLQHQKQIKAVTDYLEPAKNQEDIVPPDNVVEKHEFSFLDKLASTRILKEEEEQSKEISPAIDKIKGYNKNRDDISLEPEM